MRRDIATDQLADKLRKVVDPASLPPPEPELPKLMDKLTGALVAPQPGRVDISNELER